MDFLGLLPGLFGASVDFPLRLSRDSTDFVDFLHELSGISLEFHGFPAWICCHNFSQPMILWIFSPTSTRFHPCQGVFSPNHPLLTTSQLFPPMGNTDPLLLAVISIDLKGMAQHLAMPLIGTQVIDTVLHIDIGTESVMTRPEWPGMLG